MLADREDFVQELVLDWIVEGPIGPIATYTRFEDAEFYANALRELRGLDCHVTHRSSVKESKQDAVNDEPRRGGEETARNDKAGSGRVAGAKHEENGRGRAASTTCRLPGLSDAADCLAEGNAVD